MVGVVVLNPLGDFLDIEGCRWEFPDELGGFGLLTRPQCILRMSQPFARHCVPDVCRAILGPAGHEAATRHVALEMNRPISDKSDSFLHLVPSSFKLDA